MRPLASNYSRGAAYERRVLHMLEGHGWSVARHPLSRGAADLDAYKGGVHLMVQVKGGAEGRSMRPSEWNRLFDLAAEAGAVPVLANKAAGRWRLWRLTGRKDARGPQPMEPYEDWRDDAQPR